jgi:hypothetical protein
MPAAEVTSELGEAPERGGRRRKPSGRSRSDHGPARCASGHPADRGYRHRLQTVAGMGPTGTRTDRGHMCGRSHRLSGPTGRIPWQLAAKCADRHQERAVPPMAAISLSNVGRSMWFRQARQIVSSIAQLRAFGQYVQSGQDSDDATARTARIRADLQALLTIPGLEVPRAPWSPTSTS